MDWVKALVLVLKLVEAFTTALHDRKLIADALAQATLRHIQKAQEDIHEAEAARKAVRDSAASDPAGLLRDDDGFRRD